jgi:hypothetical protein
MSVALPVIAIAFGSVAPPQGDVIDLRVHLGCTNEISSFECTLQNWDKKYSSGGTYPIIEGSIATIAGGRDPDCPLLLTGKAEEVDPESRAVEHYIVVRGRCNGLQLFRRHVIKDWENVKGEVVVKYVIDNYTSLSHTRGGVELIEDTDTMYTRLEYEETQVFDIVKYVGETADKAGAIGFDFRIAPDGKFEFFQKNSKTSSVNLSERLEVGSHKRSIQRIKNKITIYGAAEASRPPNIDDWTDSLTNWSAEVGTLSLYTLSKKYGSYSIRCDSSTDTLRFKRTFDRVKNPQVLSFWIESYDAYAPELSWVRLLAPDDDNYFEFLFSNIPDDLTIDWVLAEIALGKSNTYNAATNPNGKWTKTGSPTWLDIQGIKFQIKRGAYTGVAVVVDGIQFGKVRFEATREDATSQGLYDVIERQPEIDEELHSDAECDYRAKALLDFLKGPSIMPTVRSTVIDYGTTPILAGDKGHIVLPNENVDADYRLTAVEYRFNVTELTLEIKLQLEKEQLLLADFIYGFRKSILKLDKYKASR